MYEGGIEGMYYSVSETAEYGGLTRGDRVIDEGTKKRMVEILEEIQKGEFAKEWMKESADGMPNMEKMRNSLGEHQIEKVGKDLRSMMNWIDNDKSSEPEPAE
jgi:ketol-acid reductoisomerase